MNTLKTMALENCHETFAMVVELEKSLGIPKRRKLTLQEGLSRKSIEAITSEYELLAIDLALELEALEQSDRDIMARRAADAARRQAERCADPTKFFLAELAAKADREEARKQAMAAWQKLRSAQKQDGVPAESRARLSPAVDSFDAGVYRFIAAGYLAAAEPIMQEIEYYRRRDQQRREQERNALEANFRHVLELGNQLGSGLRKQPRRLPELSAMTDYEIRMGISEMYETIRRMRGMVRAA
jgi:hypothetical protein